MVPKHTEAGREAWPGPLFNPTASTQCIVPIEKVIRLAEGKLAVINKELNNNSQQYLMQLN
jgi:hypothetical protein